MGRDLQAHGLLASLRRRRAGRDRRAFGTRFVARIEVKKSVTCASTTLATSLSPGA
jgi:hypothetical protein